MAQGGEDPYKAVERVLSGAVSKVLSQFKAEPSRGKQRRQRSTDGRRQSSSPSSSSDDDFQQAPPAKKLKPSK